MSSRSSSWASKVSGFFRFYGQRVLDALRRVYGRHGQRTPLQRSLVFLTAALVAVGVYAGWAGSWLRRAQAPSELADWLDQGDADRLAGLPDGGTGPGNLLDRAGLWDDPILRATDVADGLVSPVGEQPVSGGEDEPVLLTEAESGDSVLALALDSRAPASGNPDSGSSSLTREPAATPGAMGTAATGTNASAGTAEQASGSAARSPSAAGSTRALLPQVSVTSMVLPVSGEVIQPYGWYRHPVFEDWRYSTSVVLEPADDGLVRAALAGRVRDVVYEGGLWRISIDHAGGWQTEYSGLLEVAVSSFEVVDTGQVIGRLDRQAGWGVGFAVRQGDVAVNPLSLVGDGALPATAR